MAAPIPLVEFPDEVERFLPTYLAETAERVGPLFRRVIGGGPQAGEELIYLVGPEANRLVLHTAREQFSHELGWTPVIGERMGRGLLHMDGAEWARHRQMMNPAFTSAYMAGYVPLMERVIARRTAGWLERGEVDLFAEAREITFDVAAGALVSQDEGPEVDRARELFYGMFHAFDPALETWEEFRRRWTAYRGELEGMARRWIRARRNGAEGAPGDVLGLIARARDEDGRELDEEQVVGHVMILLLAGHETTTVQSAWLLYLLATHPEARARVEAEVDAHLDGGAITFEALREMEYLGHAVREAGRLHSPVTVVPRGVVADVELAGQVIPAGAQVRLGLAGTHRIGRIFAAPERFDPGRLAPPREEDRRAPYSLVTFGGGPRVCIGINFAQIEMRALAAYVLRRFRIEPIPDREPTPVHYITQFLPEGVPVRVRPRAGTAGGA
ncbi:MAG TPA: cytochrome P450 [Chloroflexota bacterium]|jgi:cytochrome P450|nr:cytochrome P450 [Chloroflexota bacterium]